jgi:hypothetical protein
MGALPFMTVLKMLGPYQPVAGCSSLASWLFNWFFL